MARGLAVWKGLVLALLGVWLGVTGCTDASTVKNPRHVVAMVGDAPIYAKEFKRALARQRLQNDEGLPVREFEDLRRRALLDDLIERQLLLSTAQASHVVVTIDEVEAAYQRMRSGWTDTEFERELQAKDSTPAELRRELRALLTVRKFMQERVFARVAVTDEEIRAFVDENPDVRKVPEQIRVRQIVVRTEEQAKKVQKEVRRGLPFEDAAMKYSVSADGPSGGDLGYFARGTMPQFFDDACFPLRPRQVSKIVESPYGYHLFKLIDRKRGRTRSYDEVRDEVEVSLRREKEARARQELVARLRAGTRVIIGEDVLARLY